MKTIRLYGELGKKFGTKFELDVANPAEAVRALCVVVNGFRDYMIVNAQASFRVSVGKQVIGADELSQPNAGVIKLVPVVAGSGGLGKIVLGAALIYFSAGLTSGAMWAAGAAGTSVGTTLAIGGMVSSVASSIGWSLVLGGVSSMLFSPPKPSSGGMEKADNKPSYAFDGAVNTIGQGNCVPVCYGELIVGSQVISAGLSAQDIPV